jgi:transposase-like protein
VELLGRYSNIPKLPILYHSTAVDARPVTPARVHAARRRLSANTIQQLATDYQAGVPSTQLAKRYGVSKGAVLRLLREQGIPVRRQSMTAIDIEQAIQLYRSGSSLAAVGAKLGYDHGTIHRALRQAGVAMRDSHGRER